MTVSVHYVSHLIFIPGNSRIMTAGCCHLDRCVENESKIVLRSSGIAYSLNTTINNVTDKSFKNE